MNVLTTFTYLESPSAEGQWSSSIIFSKPSTEALWERYWLREGMTFVMKQEVKYAASRPALYQTPRVEKSNEHGGGQDIHK